MPGASETPNPRLTTAEVLACFDDEFKEFARSFAKGEYLLWLGSGLSRSVVPDVRGLLKNLLLFLQKRRNANDEVCRFTKAINEVLVVSGIPDQARDAIDLDISVDNWPDLDNLIDRLADKYATVLNVPVDDEARDYLVWDAIDVPGVYGADDLEPDAEHLCVAILMLEGVVRSAPTTNWDGLVETAVDRLSGGVDAILRVVVHQNDFTNPQSRADLVKFHGCAVRAVRDEEKYRPLLVARKAQISGWATKPENRLMKDHLEHLLATQPAIVVGLSAQDADIHTMLYQARENLARSWPAVPPAVVFAVQELDHHHTHMLEATYGDAYAANRPEIVASALLRAYAKPALLGLVLFTLADKLCALIASLPSLELDPGQNEKLQDYVRRLRDDLGQASNADPRAFTDQMIAAVSLVLAMFRSGIPPEQGTQQYQPLTAQPIAKALADPNFPGEALGQLAVAASLFGRGLASGRWKLVVGDVARPEHGSLQVVVPSGDVADVFVVQGAGVLSTLETNDLVDMTDPNVVIIHAEEIPKRFVRSPKQRIGRTGKLKSCELSIETIGAAAMDADELFDTFCRESNL